MTKVAETTYQRMIKVIKKKQKKNIKADPTVRLDNEQLQHRHSQQDWHNVEINE